MIGPFGDKTRFGRKLSNSLSRISSIKNIFSSPKARNKGIKPKELHRFEYIGSSEEGSFIGSSEKSENEVIKKGMDQEQNYSLVGLSLGAVIIIGGIFLSILGISGEITWIVESPGISSKVYNASPGVVLFIVGLFIIIFTRRVVKIKR